MDKFQRRILTWVAAGAVGTGALPLWLGEPAIAIAALLSVLFVAIVLISRGFSAYTPNTSPSEYFGASSLMGSLTTLQSLGSSWVMLGNVIVAGMILGQVFGIVAIWVVATWSVAFVLMSHRVDRVRSVLQADDTLHTFLHRVYASSSMRLVAAAITVFVGFGVFCTELIAAIALLIAVLPFPQGAIIAPLLILLLVVAMCVAVIAGGLRAVITTDAMLWPVVIVGVVTMLSFAVVLGSAMSPEQAFGKLIPAALDPAGIVAFLVGIAALQVPLLLGDFGTWQRIKATRSSESKSLASHTLRQAGWQAFLWGVPVVAGISILGLPALYEAQSGNLYGSSYPLIEFVRHWIAASEVPLVLRAGLISVFLVGMLAVMVSTANSYLLIAMETWVRDLNPHSLGHGYKDAEALDRAGVSRARLLCIFISLVACLPIAMLVQFNVSLVTIIVIVFSVQVALAPAAAFALYFPDVARRHSRVVVLSTIGGFVAALAYGFFTGYVVTGWWRDYGSFLTAGVALGVPAITICFGLFISDQGPKGVHLFLTKLLWPWNSSDRGGT
jgi:SSS family solute:Na+ symporter